MKVAGLMFVRDVGAYTILCSVVKSESVPNLKREHQHLVLGQDNGEFTDIQIDRNNTVDLTELAKGQSIDGLLTSQIWRTD